MKKRQVVYSPSHEQMCMMFNEAYIVSIDIQRKDECSENNSNVLTDRPTLQSETRLTAAVPATLAAIRYDEIHYSDRVAPSLSSHWEIPQDIEARHYARHSYRIPSSRGFDLVLGSNS
ncbi:hypothetical protein N9B17_01335 [Rhodopirellula sp.]|nr:hypothetical protein [Rhodopirellula sp.]